MLKCLLVRCVLRLHLSSAALAIAARATMQALLNRAPCPHLAHDQRLPQPRHARGDQAACSTSGPAVCRSAADRSGMAAQAAPAAVQEAAVVERRPTRDGRYGKYGGKYVPETLIAALASLEEAYEAAMQDESFKVGLLRLHRALAPGPGTLCALPERAPTSHWQVPSWRRCAG